MIRLFRKEQRREIERIDTCKGINFNVFCKIFQVVMDNVVTAQKIALLNKSDKRANIRRMKDVASFFDGTQIINFMIAQTNFAVDKYNLFVHCTVPFTNLNVSCFCATTTKVYEDQSDLKVSLVAVCGGIGIGHGYKPCFQCRLYIIFAERHPRF